MTLLAIGIGIRTAIINTKIIIIGVIIIAIDAEAIAVIIIEVIKIRGVITPLGNKKIRISIRIKGLRGTLV